MPEKQRDVGAAPAAGRGLVAWSGMGRWMGMEGHRQNSPLMTRIRLDMERRYDPPNLKFKAAGRVAGRGAAPGRPHPAGPTPIHANDGGMIDTIRGTLAPGSVSAGLDAWSVGAVTRPAAGASGEGGRCGQGSRRRPGLARVREGRRAGISPQI